MSRKKKNPRPTAKKPPPPPSPPPIRVINESLGGVSVKETFSSIAKPFKEWNKKRKERQLEKQELNELASVIAEDIKVMADRIALLELADRQEKRAQQLRKMAEELT